MRIGDPIMKITKQSLRRLIKEETSALIKEIGTSRPEMTGVGGPQRRKRGSGGPHVSEPLSYIKRDPDGSAQISVGPRGEHASSLQTSASARVQAKIQPLIDDAIHTLDLLLSEDWFLDHLSPEDVTATRVAFSALHNWGITGGDDIP